VFKNRSLLIGLGIGLIVGSSVLQLVNAASRLEQGPMLPTTVQDVESLSEAQLKDAAAKKGFVLLDSKETWFNQKQLEDARKKVSEEIEAKLRAELSAAAPGATEEVQFKKGVYIKPRSDAFSVAAQLKEFGIVEDTDKFIDSITQQKLNTKIQFGYFEFPPNASLQDVITTITAIP
jgi:hypothetical protein